MSGLDELLDLFDNDPDWDSSDDDDPFKALDDSINSKTKSVSDNKNKAPAPSGLTSKSGSKTQNKEFENLFGVPHHTGIPGNSSAAAVKPQSFEKKSVSASGNLDLSKIKPSSNSKPYYNGINGSQVQKPLPTLSQMQGLFVVDPFTKTRVVRSSASHLTIGADGKFLSLESSLQDRNTGMQYVNLSTIPRWFRGGGNKDKVQFWTSGILARKPPGLRKSSKGNDYGLWEIVDLSNVEQSWTVFLFGSAVAASALSSVTVGSLVDLLNPSILEDSAGARMKLSINNSNQVRPVGEAKDFGYCESKKKDGNPCTAVVNKFECPVCIHHASAELKKANRKKNNFKAKMGMGLKKPGSEFGSFSESQERKNGIRTIDFGPLTPQPVAAKSKLLQKPSSLPTVGAKQLVRMELQDPSNILKRNPAALGNHTSISFKKEPNPLPLPEHLKKPSEKKPINLDPLKTRHLTDKDRQILEALGGNSSISKMNSELPAMLSSPNAGARNFLKFLNQNDGKSPDEIKERITANTPEAEPGTKLTMTRETLLNMQKALNYVKTNGPILKKNPNSINKTDMIPKGLKRKLSDEENGKSRSIEKSEIDTKTKKTAEAEELERIINAKSAHAGLAETLQETDYFEKLERKEAVENKMLNTFKVPTTAVMCRECKYVALGRSDLCKDLGHEVRIVKAIKRFFKCKDCGNKAMSLDRLPRRPCTNCKQSNWEIAPMGHEKKGPALGSETLSIRGDEEKFLGSTSGKLFL